MPGTIPSASCVRTNLILVTILWYYYHVHFKVEEMAKQRDSGTLPKSHSE